MKKKPAPFFSIIFHVGALLGYLLTGIATWADLEAASYGFDRLGGERLDSLHCPILMTTNEMGSFSVKLSNNTDRMTSSHIKTDITTRLRPVTSHTSLELAPGESRWVEWKIGPKNLKLGQFILIHTWVSAQYPRPDHENVCGVFIANLPWNGRIITGLTVGLSLLGICIGLYGMMKSPGTLSNKQVDRARFIAMALLVIAGIVVSFMGLWIFGMIIMVASSLLIVVSIFGFR